MQSKKLKNKFLFDFSLYRVNIVPLYAIFFNKVLIL